MGVAAAGLLILFAAPLRAQALPAPPVGAEQRLRETFLQRLLDARAELALTSAQVGRIEEIARTTRERNQPLLERLRAAGPGSGEGPREMSPEERRAHWRRMERLRPLRMELLANTRSAIEAARQVLTPEQRVRLHEMLLDAREERRQNRPADW